MKQNPLPPIGLRSTTIIEIQLNKILLKIVNSKFQIQNPINQNRIYASCYKFFINRSLQKKSSKTFNRLFTVF